MIPSVLEVCRSNGNEKVNWLELPDDIVYNIANRFTRQRELIRFGIVCHSWRSIYTDIHQHRSPRLPLLMLATDLNQDDQTRSFYNVSDSIVCNTNVNVPHDRHCPGSSHGWVATVTPDLQVRLINPFNRNEIPLPPLEAFEKDTETYPHPGFLSKIVLSRNPASDPNYVILAIHGAGSLLTYYKPGDKAWTSLDHSKYYCIVDAIRYRDQFYAINSSGVVYAIDLDNTEPRVLTVAPSTPKHADKRYLVDSSGDLLQILRHTEFEDSDTDDSDCDSDSDCDDNDDNDNVDGDDNDDGDGDGDGDGDNNGGDGDGNDNGDDDGGGGDEFIPSNYFNNGFDVFKWDPIDHKWIELHSLGDCMLFVGDNSSLCVSAPTFPKCVPNSIYY